MSLFKKKDEHIQDIITRVFRVSPRYKRLKKVGSGALANVTSLFDAALNRVVAIKELKEDANENADLVKGFVTEARLVSYLDHPGIVPVFDSFLAETSRPCYTMKLMDGRTLTTVMKETAEKGRLLSPAECLEIAVKLCETLAYAHDKGVIHLDLKPDNIMIGRYGEVMVMDWGSARLYDTQPYLEHLRRFVDNPDGVEVEKESENFILGTPQYMSPEQTRVKRKDLSPASDVFSTGVMLYEMLTGLLPFQSDSVDGLLHQIRTAPPEPVHDINPIVPRRLSQICMRMLEKELDVRYQNCREVIEELHEFRDSGQAFQTRSFTTGQVVFEENAPGEYAFLILSGSVEISKVYQGSKKILAVLGKNEIVGELAIFSGQARTATVTALEPTTVRIMKKEDVERELEKLSPWVEKMITGLCQRFIDLNQKLLEVGRP